MRGEVQGVDCVYAGHRPLGYCWIAYGILQLIAAVILVVSSGTATVMFGALLVRVADPFTLMTLFHVAYLAAILLLAAGGLAGILAGLALASGAGSGKKLALLAAIVSVSEIPIGTTLGVYTLVTFLPHAPRLASAS